MISGILAGEIPGFRIELCCFLHPSSGPCVFVVFPLLSCVVGLRNMTHHLLPQQIFFTHNWNLSRHCCVVVCFLFVCVLCGLFLLACVLFLLLVLCVSVLFF